MTPRFKFLTPAIPVLSHLIRRSGRFSALAILGFASVINFGGLIDVAEAQPRIVGGTTADADAYPWMVGITRTGFDSESGNFCGGSLIAPRWVLTAAHCVDDATPNEIYAVIGRADLRGTEGETRKIDRIVVHPDYGRTDVPDIALLRLSTASSKQPVSLVPAGSGLASPGTLATVIGWGAVAEDGYGTRRLRETQIPIIGSVSCARAYGGGVDAALEICAGVEQGGRDACQGDSGGPLFVESNQRGDFFQAGVVSWGQGCAQPGFPGVYARVSTLIDWMSDVTGGDLDEAPVPSDAVQTELSANFTVDCQDLTCSFNGKSSTPGVWPINEYVWNFGDGQFDYGRTATHTYDRDGYFNATLHVIDSQGNRTSRSLTAHTVDFASYEPVRYSGFLGNKDAVFEPREGGEWIPQGPLRITLKQSKDSNLYLKLQKYDPAAGKWSLVELAKGEDRRKRIIKNDAEGALYRYRVINKTGSGDYTLTIRHD